MTGKYPWTSNDAKILPGNAALIIDTKKITLPKMLKQAGYTTGSVGKWYIRLGYGCKLYNLKNDIGQQENLAEKCPKRLGEMINRLEAFSLIAC